MPRSLNEPVGFMPSNLTHTSAPVRARQRGGGEQRRAALAEGDDGRGVRDVQPVGVFAEDSAPLTCADVFTCSFDSQDGRDAFDDAARGELGDGLGERLLLRLVRSDDQA